MDPVTLITALVEVLGLLAHAAEQLKKFWNAGRDLKTLLMRVSRAQRTIECILEVAKELKTAGLDAVEFSLDVFVNPLRDVIRKILRQVGDVVNVESGKLRPKFVQKLLFTLSRDKLGDLEKELNDLETGMLNQVNALNLLATVKHLGIARSTSLKSTGDSESEVHDAFSDAATLVSLGDDDSEQAKKQQTQILRTWLGNLDTDKHDYQYVQWRHELSDAAKYGQWDDMFELMAKGLRVYGESWVNAPRIKRGEDLSFISLWTPLHQAVYMGAPIPVVSKLLQLGASKTSRTRWTEFPWPDMSPLELAQHLGATELIDMLRPTIRMPVPLHVLHMLQGQFHQLIEYDMGSRYKAAEWCLPQLEPLLELDAREWIWFPVGFGGGHGDRDEGYWYCIDGRDLLIRADNVRDRGGYRISVDGVFEVEQAIVS